jgi:hypothetical protein
VDNDRDSGGVHVRGGCLLKLGLDSCYERFVLSPCIYMWGDFLLGLIPLFDIVAFIFLDFALDSCEKKCNFAKL